MPRCQPCQRGRREPPPARRRQARDAPEDGTEAVTRPPPWSARPPPRLKAASSRPTPRRHQAAGADAVGSRRCRCPEPEKAPAERQEAARYALPPLALLDAPRGEQKIDERELMDGARLLEEKCREFSVEGHGRPDPPRPRRDDLRVQAGRRRQVQQDHRPGRRPVPRDAGRVGPDRSHPRQVDRRHPDSQPEPRADLAARAARVGRLPALAPRSSRSRSARPSTASRSSATWRRCRTC